jgi:hypothetical protein
MLGRIVGKRTEEEELKKKMDGKDRIAVRC